MLGTACVSEWVLKTLACPGLRVGPSKATTLQCEFWPRSFQILIWISPWIFGWWMLSSCFFLKVSGPKQFHQRSPRKIHPEIWLDKFPSDFWRDLLLTNSETGRRRFRGVRCRVSKHRAKWVFRGTLSFGERAQSVPFSLLFVCVNANSPSFPQNWPSLLQNSVSSLFRNSTLETVFRPFPANEGDCRRLCTSCSEWP